MRAGGQLEASKSYMFGVARFGHFLFSFIFFFNFVYRLYWKCVGNKYARWNNFIPMKKRQWQEIWFVIKVDILQIKRKDIESAVHNSLASLTNFITFPPSWGRFNDAADSPCTDVGIHSSKDGGLPLP